MNVLETVRRQFINARTNNLHCVSVFWVSPFDSVENRVGYFEDYTEAELFKKSLSTTYADKYVYSIYMDGVCVESSSNKIEDK